MKSPQNKQFVTVKPSDFRSHMLHRFWYELRLQKSIILIWKINQDNMIRVRNKEKKIHTNKLPCSYTFGWNLLSVVTH